jgi:hypothetical protein
MTEPCVPRPSCRARIPDDVVDVRLWWLSIDVAAAHQPDDDSPHRCTSLLCEGKAYPCPPARLAQHAAVLSRRPLPTVSAPSREATGPSPQLPRRGGARDKATTSSAVSWFDRPRHRPVHDAAAMLAGDESLAKSGTHPRRPSPIRPIAADRRRITASAFIRLPADRTTVRSPHPPTGPTPGDQLPARDSARAALTLPVRPAASLPRRDPAPVLPPALRKQQRPQESLPEHRTPPLPRPARSPGVTPRSTGADEAPPSARAPRPRHLALSA